MRKVKITVTHQITSKRCYSVFDVWDEGDSLGCVLRDAYPKAVDPEVRLKEIKFETLGYLNGEGQILLFVDEPLKPQNLREFIEDQMSKIEKGYGAGRWRE